ncbi:MAG: hypothetical protein ACTSX6_02510 [Candidatus Heimdallarchaeaceae archaeon]
MKDYTRLNSLDEWEIKILIFLLEKPRKPNEILLFRFPEVKKQLKKKKLEDVYRNKSQYFTRKGFGHIWKLKQTGLLKERKKTRSTIEPYDIDWNVLLDKWEKEIIERLGYRFKITLDLRNFIIRNRAFLFNSKDFKILFYHNGDWCLPSVFGVMIFGLFYGLVAIFEKYIENFKEKKQVRNTIENIRIAEQSYLSSIGLTKEEIIEKEQKIIERKIKQCKVEDYQKVVKLLYNFFKEISTCRIPVYIPGRGHRIRKFSIFDKILIPVDSKQIIEKGKKLEDEEKRIKSKYKEGEIHNTVIKTNLHEMPEFLEGYGRILRLFE